VVTEQRLTAFRFLFFLRSPDFASLHPGYVLEDPIVINPVTTTGFI
jgi:hypothetical protein